MQVASVATKESLIISGSAEESGGSKLEHIAAKGKQLTSTLDHSFKHDDDRQDQVS